MVRSQFGSIRFLRFMSARGTYSVIQQCVNECDGRAYLPIVHLRRIRVERQDFELYRVELVNLYRGL